MKRTMCLYLSLLLFASVLIACSQPLPAPDPSTAAYEDMVSWLTSEGYISEQADPVDINTTAGYVTDNTGGDYPYAKVADKAMDYDGLWLFWWDLENRTEEYGTYEGMLNNNGIIVVKGGACVLATVARNGAFAIAFDDDYAQKDAVLAAFNALGTE